MNQTATASEMGMLPKLQGIPNLDINRNSRMAAGGGRPAVALITEAIRLMRGAGKLSPPEYLYYRLWDQSLTLAERQAFVGKKAQHLMHLACNDRHWYQTAADKILFQTIMTGAGLPVPETLAVTQPLRWLPQAHSLIPSSSPLGCEIRRFIRSSQNRRPGNTASMCSRSTVTTRRPISLLSLAATPSWSKRPSSR
jgi:hypothetical protein